MKKERIKVWITKYWNTKGIYEQEVFLTDHYKMVVDTTNSLQCFHGNEYFTDRKDAIEYVKRKRGEKVLSLKRQIDKLENMKFE